MAEEQDIFLGRVIQDYLIIKPIGKGGMGWVYLAQHVAIGKKIAVKVLRPEYSRNPSLMTRFFREARIVNEIKHENIIDIFGFYTSPDEEFFILMELLQGYTLSQLILTSAPLSLRWIGHICLQICAALTAAHQKEVIHRDLKSDNIFLISRAGQKNFVKVLDFGLVRFVTGGLDSFTPVGTAVGTPAYMAPEQAVGDSVDARSDIYSLGIILYEMATKSVPFTAPTTKDLLRKQLISPVPAPSSRQPRIDPALEALILRCLEKDRRARFDSMGALASQLAQICGLEVGAYIREPESNSPEIQDTADTLEDDPKAPD